MPKMIKIGEIRVLNYFDLPWNEPSMRVIYWSLIGMGLPWGQDIQSKDGWIPWERGDTAHKGNLSISWT